MWQSMLMSAGIEPSKQIFINGFITVDGQKMSKSTGNVISPAEMVEKFGVDGTRYLLLSGGNFGEDMDITWERMTEKFNADLANGLGNLVSRVVKLYEKTDKDFSMFSDYNEVVTKDDQYSFFSKEEAFQIQYMRISNVLDVCMSNVKILNRKIEDSKPWELEKSNKDLFEKVMSELVKSLSALSIVLFPLLPETSQKIKTALETKVAEPLFQRIK